MRKAKCADDESDAGNRCSSMFKASPLGCHLLLGNAVLIILGGLITRLNGLDANDRKLVTTWHSLQTVASVRPNAANLPNSFNENFNKKDDSYANWSAGLPNFGNHSNTTNQSSSPAIRSTTKRRFKRGRPNKSSNGGKSASSINQPNGTIRSDNENELKQNAAEIGDRSRTPTRSERGPTTATTDEETANEIQIINNYTNDITKLGVAGTGSSTDLTNYKTNIGYKYYDPMRKQSRPNKDPKLASWNSNWNGLLKLVFLLLTATAGTTGNVFVISSVMIIEQFQMQGAISFFSFQNFLQFFYNLTSLQPRWSMK